MDDASSRLGIALSAEGSTTESQEKCEDNEDEDVEDEIKPFSSRLDLEAQISAKKEEIDAAIASKRF